MLVQFHLLPILFSFLHNYSFSFIYLQNIIPTDYIPTIPPLIQRGVSKSEHVFESFKLFSSKRFGEDVCNLIICEQCRRWTILASTWCWIKWYFVLMCLVRSWNMGFLASLIVEVLSINNGVEFSCFYCRSSSIFLSHTISFIALAAATYSASIVE